MKVNANANDAPFRPGMLAYCAYPDLGGVMPCRDCPRLALVTEIIMDNFVHLSLVPCEELGIGNLHVSHLRHIPENAS